MEGKLIKFANNIKRGDPSTIATHKNLRSQKKKYLSLSLSLSLTHTRTHTDTQSYTFRLWHTIPEFFPHCSLGDWNRIAGSETSFQMFKEADHEAGLGDLSVNFLEILLAQHHICFMDFFKCTSGTYGIECIEMLHELYDTKKESCTVWSKMVKQGKIHFSE